MPPRAWQAIVKTGYCRAMSILRSIVTLAVLAALTAACDAKPTTQPDNTSKSVAPAASSAPTVQYDVPAEHRALAERALHTLEGACPLPAADLAEIHVTVEELHLGHYLTDRHGWERVIRVEPRFHELARISPAWQRARAGGHSFDFRLGAGRAPGITADKRFGRMLCGMESESDATQYMAVPELGFLSALDPVKSQATPVRVDFAKLFQLDAAGVESVLGRPSARGTDEGDRHMFPDLTIGVEYLDGTAAQAWLTSSSMDMAAIRQWLGRQRGVLIEDAGDMLMVSSPRLPASRPALGKILGATRAEVLQHLGPSTDEDQWAREGYLITAEFEGGTVSYLAIVLSTSPEPKTRPAEYRRWAGLPAGKTMKARGHIYSIELDFAIVLQRQ